MCAGKDRRIDRDLTNFLGTAAVDALASVQHLRAERVVFDVADVRSDFLCGIGEFCEQKISKLSLDLLDCRYAGVLLFLVDR